MDNAPQQKDAGIKAFITAMVFAAATLFAQAAPPSQPDFPPASRVFRLTASADAHRLRVHWTILPGYYLYRRNFRFINRSRDVGLGTPHLPAGHRKHDEFFGDVEIYRDAVTATIPYRRHGPDVGTMKLEVIYQGCADQHFCYPPQRRVVTIPLPESD